VDGGPPLSTGNFKGRHFDHEIIVLCVRWYLTFKLSSRDLVQMMAERGIALAHTTILRWVQRYVPEFEKRWGRYALLSGETRKNQGLRGRGPIGAIDLQP
jgi:transposase-like protein